MNESLLYPIKTARGTYLLSCAENVILDEDAPEKMRLFAQSGADCIYFDERQRDARGGITDVYKPDWSPDTLLSYLYIGAVLLVSESLFARVGAPKTKDAAERSLFCIRAAFAAERVLHVPIAIATRPAENEAGEDYAETVRRALKRINRRAETVGGLFASCAAVRYPIERDTRISVIVYTNGDDRMRVRSSLESIEVINTYPNVTLHVADCGDVNEQKERYYALLAQSGAASVLRDPMGKGLARLVNRAAEAADGDALLLLRAGMRVRRHDALERMLELALCDHVGAVGAKTLDENRRLYQTPRIWGTRESLFDGAADDTNDPIKNRLTNCIRNVSLVEGALMVRRDVFHAAGGLDETLPRVGFEAALCARLMQKRLHNVYTPYAVFTCAREANEKQAPLSKAEQMRLDDVMRSFYTEGDPMLSRAEKVVSRIRTLHATEKDDDKTFPVQ